MGLTGWVERTYQRMGMMQRMIERMDVDVSRLACADNGVSYRAMVGRCRGCAQADVCIQWLDGHRPDADPGSFCPNSAAFASCRKH